MNERIKELMIESGSTGTYQVWFTRNEVHKLAELLIKECIKASMVSILDNNIGDREDCVIVGSDISDHFGME